jgi:hypothetical protein
LLLSGIQLTRDALNAAYLSKLVDNSIVGSLTITNTDPSIKIINSNNSIYYRVHISDTWVRHESSSSNGHYFDNDVVRSDGGFQIGGNGANFNATAAGALTISGALSAASASVTNALSAGSISTTGTLSAGTTTIGGLTADSGVRIKGTTNTAANYAFIGFYQNNLTTRTGFVGQGNNLNTDIYLFADTAAANVRVVPGTGGKAYVGTGTNEIVTTAGTAFTGTITTAGTTGLLIGGAAYIHDTGSGDLIWIQGARGDSANGGAVFGVSKDTNIYRSAANTLKTDDNLEVALNATISGGGLTLNNTTSNTITLGAYSGGAPTASATSAKVRLWGSGNNYAIGIESNSVWYSSGKYHKFYSTDGTTWTQRMQISDTDVTFADGYLIGKNSIGMKVGVTAGTLDFYNNTAQKLSFGLPSASGASITGYTGGTASNISMASGISIDADSVLAAGKKLTLNNTAQLVGTNAVTITASDTAAGGTMAVTGTTTFPGSGTWTTAGKVGIGTTSPGANLEINDTSLGATIKLVGALNDDTKSSTIQFVEIDTGAGTPSLGFQQRFLSNSNAFVIEGGTFPTLGTRMAIKRDAAQVSIGTTGFTSKFRVYENSADVGSNAGITIENDGAGDAILNFLLTDTQRYTVGIDNSDSDKFKIGRGDDWSTGTDITVDTAGNVGVGTASPSSKFHVNGGNIKLALTAGETPYTISSYSNGTSLWFLGGGTTQELIMADSHDWDRGLSLRYVAGTTATAAGELKIGQLQKNSATGWTHGITSLYTNGVERMRIDKDGKMGLGTTSPGSKFHVVDATSGDGSWVNGIRIENTGTTTGEAAISFKNAGASGTGSNFWIVGLNQSANLGFNYGTSFSDSTNKVTFTAGGRVSIASGVSPTHKLDITQESVTSAFALRNETTAARALVMFSGPNGSVLDAQGATTGAGLHLRVNSSEKITMTSTGVGINNNSPAEALDVVGNIKASGSIQGSSYNFGTFGISYNSTDDCLDFTYIG